MRPPVRGALLAVALLIPLTAAAQELDPNSTPGALQNRAYSMSLEVNVPVVGVLPIDAFYKGYTLGAGVVVHFTDFLGWQVARGGYSFNVSTPLRDQLERDFSQLPTAFDEVSWFVGSDLMLKPFYGKSSVLNTWVVHYEAFFLVGASLLKYSVAGFAGAINLGGGLRIFQTKFLSYRIDVTDSIVINSRGLNQILSIQLMLGWNIGGGE